MKTSTLGWILLATLVGCQTGPPRRTPDPTQLVESARAPRAPASPAVPPRAASQNGERRPERGAVERGRPRVPHRRSCSPRPRVRPSRRPILGAMSAQAESVPAPARQFPPLPAEEPVDAAEMSLSDALATGLSQNPDLVTIRGTANVGAAVIDVARVYPWNPFVQAQFSASRPSVCSRDHAGQPGRRSELLRLADAAIRAGPPAALSRGGGHRRLRPDALEHPAGGALNVTQTERLFFTALYQRQLRDLAYDTETSAGNLLEVVQRRFQAGIATAVEIANARVAARQSHRQLQLAEAAYQAALLALRQQLGLPANTPLNLAGDLTEYEWQPVADVFCWLSQSAAIDPTMLAVEVAEARPDVMAARSAAAIARANLIWPGPPAPRTCRPVRSIPRPTTARVLSGFACSGTSRFGTTGPPVLAARNRAAAAGAGPPRNWPGERPTRPPRRSIATNGRGGSWPKTPRPAARRPASFQQVLAQFEAGKADIVSVLGIQNNLLSEQRGELDLVNEVAQAAAQVTQSTGIPPERLLAPPRPEPLPSPVEPPAPPEVIDR